MNTNEKRLYTFRGAVKVYERVVAWSYSAETCATSEKKARSNIAYQYKKQNNLAPHAPVQLVGKVVAA